MRSVTASGWLIIATCELLISTVWALALAAMTRSASGGMAWSCLATRYQEGDRPPCWNARWRGERRQRAWALASGHDCGLGGWDICGEDIAEGGRVDVPVHVEVARVREVDHGSAGVRPGDDVG